MPGRRHRKCRTQGRGSTETAHTCTSHGAREEHQPAGWKSTSPRPAGTVASGRTSSGESSHQDRRTIPPSPRGATRMAEAMAVERRRTGLWSALLSSIEDGRVATTMNPRSWTRETPRDQAKGTGKIAVAGVIEYETRISRSKASVGAGTTPTAGAGRSTALTRSGEGDGSVRGRATTSGDWGAKASTKSSEHLVRATATLAQLDALHMKTSQPHPANRDRNCVTSLTPPSPTSATRGQNAYNSLISGSRKPKVGTTRPRAEGEDKGDSDADSRRGLGR